MQRLLAQGHEVLPLYLRCGLSWERAEMFWLRRFLRAIRSPRLHPVRVIEAPLRSTYGAHWSLSGRAVPNATSADEAVYLPGRNVFLLTHAAVVCVRQGISDIAIGVLRNNPFGDASPRFFRRMSACLTQALRHPIRIRAPLRRWDKPHVIRSARELPLELTYSCLAPRGHRHCGGCNKCAERRRAFRAAGVPDPTNYVQLHGL